jgi:eukaryotic-like serine/threonine-protein kinase
MAAVHWGRQSGHAGFAKTVAIKQLHPSFAEDPAVVSTILDEARLAARVVHPNVVTTLDVVVDGTDILLVLEYVHGMSLSELLRASSAPPEIDVAVAIVSAVLRGLHAAHEARSEDGEALAIVHRDVSPQNVMVGADGTARVLDFGIAKARGRLQTTREGQVKGKLSYMAPEQIRMGEVTRRTDVFAAGIVLWETVTGGRLFAGENEGHIMMKVIEGDIPSPSATRADLTVTINDIIMRALERDPGKRFESAAAFASALESCGMFAPPSKVAAWVANVAGETLASRALRLGAIERGDTHEPSDAAPKPSQIETRPDASPVPDPQSTAKGATARDSEGTRDVAIVPPAAGRRPSRRAKALAFTALIPAVAMVLWNLRKPQPSIDNAALSTSEPASRKAQAPVETIATPPHSGSVPSASGQQPTEQPPRAAHSSRPATGVALGAVLKNSWINSIGYRSFAKQGLICDDRRDQSGS